MKITGLTPVPFIGLGAVLLTLVFGAAAIFIPLIGTLMLVYLAFTTPPPAWRQNPHQR